MKRFDVSMQIIVRSAVGTANFLITAIMLLTLRKMTNTTLLGTHSTLETFSFFFFFFFFFLEKKKKTYNIYITLLSDKI